MLNLLDKNINYFIITSFKKENTLSNNLNKNSQLEDSIYLLDYEIQKIDGFYNGFNEESFICYTSDKDNNVLRRDCLYLIDKYNQQCALIKYSNESFVSKISKDGGQVKLKKVNFDVNNENNISYFQDGFSVSFCETKNYKIVDSKEQLKNGMIIEYCVGSDIWKEKEIVDIDTEWTKAYSLLSKYKKIRY